MAARPPLRLQEGRRPFVTNPGEFRVWERLLTGQGGWIPTLEKDCRLQPHPETARSKRKEAAGKAPPDRGHRCPGRSRGRRRGPTGGTAAPPPAAGGGWRGVAPGRSGGGDLTQLEAAAEAWGQGRGRPILRVTVAPAAPAIAGTHVLRGLRDPRGGGVVGPGDPTDTHPRPRLHVSGEHPEGQERGLGAIWRKPGGAGAVRCAWSASHLSGATIVSHLWWHR